MQTTLYEIIVKSATHALSLLDETTGKMPSGHNGLMYDPETSVRNSSHWLITFAKAYEISQDIKFLDAVQQITNYLCSDDARPHQATFWHRKNPKKNFCNGLIGQAWTIEALIIAANILEREDLIKLGESVFLLHPFDEDIALWYQVEIDGNTLYFDVTFNHQLWFAASGSLLSRKANQEIKQQVNLFMDYLPQHLMTYPSGLIYHLLSPTLLWKKSPRYLLSFIKQSTFKYRKLHYRAIGYHAFNLYAFALLYKILPQHKFWSSSLFQSILDYAKSESYVNQLENNKFGYPYNPAGFEIAFTLETFENNHHEQKRKWIEKQLNYCYNSKTNFMENNTEDPITHAARLYEVTRLSDINLDC